MLARTELLELQRSQYAHDLRNHFDILSLPKAERLKHYGLHFAKYVGRLYRQNEPKPLEATLTDILLVSLSAANSLHQRLDDNLNTKFDDSYLKDVSFFADAAGRFADACEKQDHLEEFLAQIKVANIDIFTWALFNAGGRSARILNLIENRRMELVDRQFFS